MKEEKQLTVRDEVNEIMDGIEITIDDLKKVSTLDPKLQSEINKFLTKHKQDNLNNQVLRCNVEYIDISKTLEDFQNKVNEEEDDDDILDVAMEKYKQHLKVIKKNEKNCPNFRTCPLFLANSLRQGEQCPFEKANTIQLVNGLYKELDIKEDDFADQLSVGHMIALENMAKRAEAAIANLGIATDITTYSKGGVTYDSKVSDYFIAYEKIMSLLEKLKKNLILDRESKMKNKKLESEINQSTIKEKLKNKMFNKGFDINTEEIANAIVLEDDEKINLGE